MVETQLWDKETVIQRKGTMKVHFLSYHKHIFTFANEILEITIRGDSGDVYYWEVKPTYKVEDLLHYKNVEMKINGHLVYDSTQQSL